jgi:signal transduction histidine kinase
VPSRWYRSLYWRIAIGFMVSLAAMLVVQAVLFVWVASLSGPTMPGQPPDRFAQTVAVEIAAALERDPALDLAPYIRDQYGRDTYPFVVLLVDGRVLQNIVVPVPEPLLRQARALLVRRAADASRQGGEAGSADPDLMRPDRRQGFGRGGPRFRPMRPAPILVNGELAGVVAVPPRAPFVILLRQYAPTLALVGTGVLVAGALLTAVVIFGPARRRLRGLEEAARRLGSGDLSARAPDRGGDEVAAVASAFNAMADDLTRRAEALAASDRARRQLLADVSHELTTPVTAMRGYLETLAMPELALDETTRARYLGVVADESARLEHMIGDLLDLARLEGGGGAFVVEAVPVAHLFARVVARHERAGGEADVALKTTIGTGADTVRGDPNRLEQALQNLTANALRYAPPGSAIDLGAQPAADGDGVTFTVADEGRGIAPAHLPHVFDRFYKTDMSRADSGGSGLGLSIVKAIIERHGGHISVSSRPGRTIFQFTIPAAS